MRHPSTGAYNQILCQITEAQIIAAFCYFRIIFEV